MEIKRKASRTCERGPAGEVVNKRTTAAYGKMPGSSSCAIVGYSNNLGAASIRTRALDQELTEAKRPLKSTQEAPIALGRTYP